MSQMPAVYIGHGAPMLLDDALWTSELASIAAGIEKPTAILIVSAHWEAEPITLSSPTAGTPLVYDFSGFDRHPHCLVREAARELGIDVLRAASPLRTCI